MGRGTKAWVLSGEASSLGGRTVEAISLDLGAEGLGSSPASPVKTQAIFFQVPFFKQLPKDVLQQNESRK